MRTRIVAGNWKMNKSFQEAVTLIEEITTHLDNNPKDHTEVIIAPPYPYLAKAVELTNDNPQLHIAAQNCHHEAAGAFTGEVAASMIRSLGAEFVIIGHSERRAFFSESNEMLRNKVDQALANDLTPIYCCGETFDERKAERHFEVIRTQVQEGLFHLTNDQLKNVIVAYEPVWAIGTGETATPEQAEEVHSFIRKQVRKKYNELADNISILYGGSCKPGNAASLFSCQNIDGGLIGGASLKSADFTSIIHA